MPLSLMYCYVTKKNKCYALLSPYMLEHLVVTSFKVWLFWPKMFLRFRGSRPKKTFPNAASKYFILCLHLCCLRFSPAWQLVLASQSAYWAQPQELLQHLFTSLHQANPEFSSHNYFQNNALLMPDLYIFTASYLQFCAGSS